MFPLSITTWIGVGLVLTLALGLYIQTERLDSEQVAFAEFKAETRVLGKAAIERKKIEDAKNKANKERNDVETKRLKSSISALTKQLRDSHPASSFVPGIPDDTKRPDLLCFDRAEYSRTDGEFVGEARRLADEGTENTIDLNQAKEWVKNIN